MSVSVSSPPQKTITKTTELCAYRMPRSLIAELRRAAREDGTTVTAILLAGAKRELEARNGGAK
jgi:hypothetical protein